jgi:uracil phosphoribosyltransferase
MLTIITNTNSLASQFLLELRCKVIQQNRDRFRRNLERVGEIAAYEISKTMRFVECEVETPLAKAKCVRLAEQPVVATILRAGIPLQQGVWRFFDEAQCAFVSAYRKHDATGGFEIAVEYLACPDLSGRVLIMCDPMLATGRSMVEVLKGLRKHGIPRETHIVSVFAAKEGVEYLADQFPAVHVWAFALDPELDPRSYIVPGLGDAGDLAFGEKVQR